MISVGATASPTTNAQAASDADVDRGQEHPGQHPEQHRLDPEPVEQRPAQVRPPYQSPATALPSAIAASTGPVSDCAPCWPQNATIATSALAKIAPIAIAIEAHQHHAAARAAPTGARGVADRVRRRLGRAQPGQQHRPDADAAPPATISTSTRIDLGRDHRRARSGPTM